MTKRTGRRNPRQSAEVTQLDETLAEVTTSTVATLKKYRYHIGVGVVVLALLMGGFAGYAALHESGLNSRNEKLWTLVLSPSAQEGDFGVSLETLDALLTDARGTAVERYVVKSVGEYLTAKAVEKDASPAEIETSGSATSGIGKEDAFKKAMALAGEYKDKFPHDRDMQTWAAGVQKRLEGERDKSWLPPSPKYKLPVPE